jgi:hypothetical protein
MYTYFKLGDKVSINKKKLGLSRRSKIIINTATISNEAAKDLLEKFSRELGCGKEKVVVSRGTDLVKFEYYYSENVISLPNCIRQYLEKSGFKNI